MEPSARVPPQYIVCIHPRSWYAPRTNFSVLFWWPQRCHPHTFSTDLGFGWCTKGYYHKIFHIQVGYSGAYGWFYGSTFQLFIVPGLKTENMYSLNRIPTDDVVNFHRYFCRGSLTCSAGFWWSWWQTPWALMWKVPSHHRTWCIHLG